MPRGVCVGCPALFSVRIDSAACSEFDGGVVGWVGLGGGCGRSGAEGGGAVAAVEPACFLFPPLPYLARTTTVSSLVARVRWAFLITIHRRRCKVRVQLEDVRLYELGFVEVGTSSRVPVFPVGWVETQNPLTGGQ